MCSLRSSLEAAKADIEAREGELSALGSDLMSRDSEAQALCLVLKRDSELIVDLKGQLASAQAALTASQHDTRVRDMSLPPRAHVICSSSTPVHRHEIMLSCTGGAQAGCCR